MSLNNDLRGHKDLHIDVDSLTISLNYVPVVAGNQTNGIAGTRDNIVTGPKDSEEDVGIKPTEVNVSGASDKYGKDDQDTEIVPSFTNQIHHPPTLVKLPNGKRAIGTKWVFRNKKDKRGIVITNKARLVAQGYTQEEGINYDEMDVKSAFLYGTLEKEVYVFPTKPQVFEDPSVLSKVYKVKKLYMSSIKLLEPGLQVQQKEDGIFISQDIYVAKFDEVLICHGEDSKSTPMEPHHALRFQVTPKMSHLHIGLLLGLALTGIHNRVDNLLARERHGCYLEKSDENAKFHQIVDFLSTCSINYALTIIVISESSVRNDLLFDDENGITCLTNDEIFENLALMGYEQLLTKLTFQKGIMDKVAVQAPRKPYEVLDLEKEKDCTSCGDPQTKAKSQEIRKKEEVKHLTPPIKRIYRADFESSKMD
ncbi:retrovirus-related pol polyprotein from transposon TNT 1-94 [Tanacetum coccineum]